MKKLVIFDLDGTLLDTVADLAACTNHALSTCGFPVHDASAYRFFVGNGINKLFERALPDGEKTTINIERVRAVFLPYYRDHSTDLTELYPGIPELLGRLQERDHHLAVASNKYHSATCSLVERFFPEIRFMSVLGQRDGIPPKPDPAIVRETMAVAGVGAPNVLYVGDSGVDMQTAGNAGIACAGVTWGFRPRTKLEQFSPRYIVDTAEQILEIAATG